MTPTTTTAEQPGSYSSPLATPRPHLGHAMASEWTKLISLRSTLWTLGSLVLTVVGVGLTVVAQTADGDYTDINFTTPALFGLLVGQLAVIVLGVLTISSEHGTGLVRTTFTAAPDRYRVLTAKYLVFSMAAFATTALSVFVVGITAAVVRGGTASGPHAAGEWFGALLGCGYVTLLGVLALAIGSLVRHSAGGIAVMLGLVTLPPVIGAMLSVWEAVAPAGRTILQHNVPVALMTLFGLPGGGDLGPDPSSLSHVTLIVLVTGSAVAASYACVGRRDV
ncbi:MULTISPECIES: ABC transporter permease [unclassified Streptomyces]|uniref:ABC transporter permease n=1 Tax=unclassified Streptomyces TaxID=2593676 RepID=UPI002E13A2C2|nr:MULTISPECIES: ABC transporter permease [unclassified Streptomyces]WSR14607.1 ABC transporter permease [Streptomyces sp. NBC_01207]WTA18516.1 ABC transporter permease [Streptomyces sp. NBC_00853]